MTPQQLPLVECDGVSVRLNGRLIIDGVSVDVNRGDTLVIHGVSGSGKTTLMRVLAGLIAPSTGALTRRVRRQGVLFQESRLLPWCDVDRNIRVGAAGRSVWSRRPDTDVSRILRRLGIGDVSRLQPHRLSGGMQRRVALARAVIGGPDVIFADEPFANLDAKSADLVTAVLSEAAQSGAALVLTGHELGDRLLSIGRHRTVQLESIKE